MAALIMCHKLRRIITSGEAQGLPTPVEGAEAETVRMAHTAQITLGDMVAEDHSGRVVHPVGRGMGVTQDKEAIRTAAATTPRWAVAVAGSQRPLAAVQTLGRLHRVGTAEVAKVATAARASTQPALAPRQPIREGGSRVHRHELVNNRAHGGIGNVQQQCARRLRLRCGGWGRQWDQRDGLLQGR